MIKDRILRKKMLTERLPGRLNLTIIVSSSVLLLICYFIVACSSPKVKESYQDILNGACYYLWYPENFTHGYLREALSPPQKPLLGVYETSDSKVIEQHLKWCRDYGIDFLAVDYWFSRKDIIKRYNDSFLPALEKSPVKFALFFETWEAGFNPVTGITELTSEKGDLLVEEIVKAATISFSHSSYLRVKGRPVIFLYLTRIMDVNAPEVISRIRDELQRIDENPYIIADEIFWNVTSSKGGFSRKPDLKRIKCFDAITAYNLYESQFPHHVKDSSGNRFLNDCVKLMKKYQKRLPEYTSIVPGIIPGYNDRGTRPDVDHYVIPRRDKDKGSFFKRMIEKLEPFACGDNPMMLITSFNEWNEDTMIEPLAGEKRTSLDISKSKTRFTQGFEYEPYGFRYLEELKNSTKAFDFLFLKNGQPLSGLKVELKKKSGETLLVKKTANDGRIYFSRSILKNEEICHISAADFTGEYTVTDQCLSISIDL